MLFETTYKYAGFEINAAQDDAKQYWVSYRTLENLFNWRKNSTREKLVTKSFKAIHGKDSQLGILSDNTNKSNSKKSWIAIGDFMTVVTWQVTEKNDTAIALVVAGFLVDFISTTHEHFGVVMDADQKEYLRELVFNRLANFKAWTDIIRDRHLLLFGVKPEPKYYRDCIKYVNQQLFGVSHFKNDRGNMTQLQQETITKFEELLIAMAKKHETVCPKRLIMKAQRFTI